ncbi:vomeronasal type-1 receptor 4-like [Dasypus novemcinctus]|uniref:vomeronasal type-1 receptor 4-like n=1 Tax=Dasypus novemcinctus TaxID=9361 RepID=UPI00265E7421|nr:vomeronasal type-1 receptor 4-like [Dasypus novemcinctus]
MTSRDSAMGVIVLLLTIFGMLGNFSFLYHYIFLSFTGCRLRSIDLIIKHLIVANSLILLCKGIPQSMAAFGLKYLFNDFICKVVFYLHRLGRGVSIGATCLLSIFQAIMVSPRNARWAELKLKASKYIGFSLFLCWIVYMLVNIIFVIYMTGSQSTKNTTNKKNFGYCTSVRHDKISDSLYAVLLSVPDALCLGLMLWANGSMVYILYRHKQRVQYIHRKNVSPKSSPESRATHTILVLVSTFVTFYTLSCIFHVCIILLNNPSWWLVNTSALINSCFPALSPFILMFRDPSVFRLHSVK